MYQTLSILEDSWSASSESDLLKLMFWVRRDGKEPGREASSVSVRERGRAGGREGVEEEEKGRGGLVGVVVVEREEVLVNEDGVVVEEEMEEEEGTAKC